MYQYRSLYGLKVGKGLLSQNDSYIVFDNIEAAYDKQNELKPFIIAEVTDIYDYYKEYRGIKEDFKKFYKQISKEIHEDNSIFTLQ